MTTFAQFVSRCKMRYDFADRIQVRYQHPDGQEIDTWVSGEEVLRRLDSADAEARLRRLGKLKLDDLKALGHELPEAGKAELRHRFRERLSDSLDETLGDSILADSLAEMIRGGSDSSGSESGARQAERQKWLDHLREGPFKAVLLELAYTQLEGSLPEDGPPGEPDDWVMA